VSSTRTPASGDVIVRSSRPFLGSTPFQGGLPRT
jgi:hypothetical protein